MANVKLALVSKIMRKEGCSDAAILRSLHRFGKDQLEEMHEATQQRAAINRALITLAENGNVAVVHGGMDCDCSRYDNLVFLVQATPRAFWEAVDRLYHDAEGPIHWRVERPSVAAKLKESHRDLALEAFENGHPTRITYTV